MRVAVVSDTHSDFRHLERASQVLGSVDWLLHAGDHMSDSETVAGGIGVSLTHVRAVVGNCDYPQTEPAEDIFVLDGVKIWLTHGHHFGVKERVDRLYYKAKELGVRVVVFGHTHVPVNDEVDGVLLFNPGSMTAPRRPGDPPSCGLLEITNDQITARHYFLR